MKVRVAKYTKVVRTKSKPTRFNHIFKLNFDTDPTKIFKAEYFRFVQIEENSIYELQPAAKSELYTSRISLSKSSKAFPYFVLFDNSAFSEVIKNVADFGHTDVISSEITKSGIRILLPEPNDRAEIQEKSPRKSKFKTKVIKHYPRVKPSVPVQSAKTEITEQGPYLPNVEGFKAALNQLNNLVTMLENVDVKIKLRLEGNTVKASLNTEL
jgi:hypothetical protein